MASRQSSNGVPEVLVATKRRGRPRKYSHEGAIAVFSPVPISAAESHVAAVPISMMPPPSPVPMASVASPSPMANSTEKKRRRGRPSRSDKNKQQRTNDEEPVIGIDEFLSTAGTDFTTHVISAKAGEDITKKIVDFCLEGGPRIICMISAKGTVSHAKLRSRDSSDCTLTYEGRFSIISLKGSFIPTELEGTTDRKGCLLITLGSNDGRVIGGLLGGLLVAAGPVELVVSTFLPPAQRDDVPPGFAPRPRTTGADNGSVPPGFSPRPAPNNADNVGVPPGFSPRPSYVENVGVPPGFAPRPAYVENMAVPPGFALRPAYVENVGVPPGFAPRPAPINVEEEGSGPKGCQDAEVIYC